MFQDEVFDKKQKQIFRVSAVDGKMSNIDTYLNTYFSGLTDKYTPSEYACLLSHLNTIKAFSGTEHQIALIMEDDATLEYKPYWKKTVADIIQNAPDDWEIILLMIIPDPPKIHLFCQNDYVHPNGICSSTGAYLINKRAANKVMKTYDRGKFVLNPQLTHQADHYLYGLLNTYAYKYPYFTYPTNNDSTIHDDHIHYHNTCKQSVNKYLYDIGRE
jgi:GR25 family glycosyltransferase involved in LPS biosynthesis